MNKIASAYSFVLNHSEITVWLPQSNFSLKYINQMIRNLINHIVYKRVRWNITKCTLLLKKNGSQRAQTGAIYE